jgi:hypothetical protein
MYAIYPFVGGTASSHKWNLKDPRNLDAAFRLIFNGGMTHSSTGVLFNGTNGWANTSSISSSPYSFGVYTRNSTDNDADYMGSQFSYIDPDPETGEVYVSGYHVNYSIYEISNLYGIQATHNSVRTGLSTVVYDGGQKLYKNGVSIASNVGYGLDSIAVNMAIGATNPNSQGLPIYGYSNQSIAFAFMSTASFNSTQNANLNTRVQAFQTTLGRQV